MNDFVQVCSLNNIYYNQNFFLVLQQAAQMVCSLDPSAPVIADADTGYNLIFHPNLEWYPCLTKNVSCRFGGPANVARTVTQYARAGVAALHIEDQVQTKRCGHLMGKQVVSREEFLTRIRAAVIARDSIPGGSDFVRGGFFLIPSLAFFTFLTGYHWPN